MHWRVKNSSIFTLSYVSVLFLCAQWHWRKIFSRQNGVSYAGSSSSKVVIIISHRLEINQAKLGGDFHLVKLDWDVPLPFLWLWEITKSDSKTVCQLWAFCNATNSIQDYSEWLACLGILLEASNACMNFYCLIYMGWGGLLIFCFDKMVYKQNQHQFLCRLSK